MSRSFLALPRAVWILWVGQFINRLGGFVLTFLPLFLTEHHHYTPARAGTVQALFGLGSLAGASLGGWATDRFGRRRTILVATVGSALVVAAFGWAPPGPLLALAAFLHGVGNAYGPALTAAISDVVPPAERKRAFGYFYWAVNLGFTCAAVLGGALAQRGYHWLFIGDAATTLGLAFVVHRFFPESRPEAREGAKNPSLLEMPRVIADPRFAGFLGAQFLLLVVFIQSFCTMPFEERAHGLTVSDVGLIAALNGVVIVVVQPLFVRVTRTAHAWRILALAAALVGAAALLVAHARTLEAFALGMAVVSLGEVAFSSAAPAFVAHIAPADRRGTYQGAYSLCWAAASLVAPLGGPALLQRWGSAAMWHVGAAMCALALAIHVTRTRRAEAAG